MGSLFGRVAREVGDALGYACPQHVEDRVTAMLADVRRLPPQPRVASPRRRT